MNLFAIVITAIAFLAIGWVWGAKSIVGFESNIENIEDALEYIDETSDAITIESANNFHAYMNIDLLTKLESSEIDTAKEQLIDSLGSFYKITNEAIDDGMASEEEKEIIQRIGTLAKIHTVFQKIVDYKSD